MYITGLYSPIKDARPVDTNNQAPSVIHLNVISLQITILLKEKLTTSFAR